MPQTNVAVKQVVAYGFWVAVAALTLNAIRVHEPTLRGALLPKRVFAYTATLQQEGTAVPPMKLIWAVRGDGSRAMEIDEARLGGVTERILNFSSGKQIYILENTRKKSTTFAPAKNLASRWLPDPDNNCLLPGSESFQLVGIEEVGGYRTARLVAGPMTVWHALDYGCAPIKDRAEWGDGQVTEKKLVALVPGEPSASLFDDPAGFEEVPPSVMFPGPNSTSQDSYYYAHRPIDSARTPQK